MMFLVKSSLGSTFFFSSPADSRCLSRATNGASEAISVSHQNTTAQVGRQVSLDNVVKSRKGGWLGGSSPDFHTLKLS